MSAKTNGASVAFPSHLAETEKIVKGGMRFTVNQNDEKLMQVRVSAVSNADDIDLNGSLSRIVQGNSVSNLVKSQSFVGTEEPLLSKSHVGCAEWIIMLLRLGLAAAIVAAITVQYKSSMNFYRARVPSQYWSIYSQNHLSYFTIVSNSLAVITLVVSAIFTPVYFLRKRLPNGNHRSEPMPVSVSRACVTTMMLLVMFVYNCVLRKQPAPKGVIVGWCNEVVHLIAPLLLLLDITFGPRVRSLHWRFLPMIIIVPLTYIIYTVVRASKTLDPINKKRYWYPYKFLNPYNPDGTTMHGRVGGVCIGILCVVLVSGALVWSITHILYLQKLRARLFNLEQPADQEELEEEGSEQSNIEIEEIVESDYV